MLKLCFFNNWAKILVVYPYLFLQPDLSFFHSITRPPWWFRWYKRLPTMRETQLQSLDQEDPPGEGNGNPLQYYCLENPMDWGRSLVGYNPWGHKDSDMTEQLHFTSLHSITREFGWLVWLLTAMQRNGLWELHKTRRGIFMENRWGNSGSSVRLYFSGLQNHCRWWLQPWN